MITRRTAFAAALAAIVVMLPSAEAQSQRSRPRLRAYQKPTTSPYLDLLQNPSRGGRSFGFEYFRRVRPEMEFREQNARIEESVRQLNTRLNRQRQDLLKGSRQPQISGTGHTTYFFNYSGYYNFGR